MTIDIQRCAARLRSLDGEQCIFEGRKLHQLLLKSGNIASLFAANCLLQMYTRCSTAFLDARRLFDEMPHRNCFSWNSLMDACISSGDSATSLLLFHAMPQKNEYSWNSLITGLVRLSDLRNAGKLFDEMPVKDGIALNAVVHGCFRRGMADDAFDVFKRAMVGNLSLCLDSFVLATMVSGCADHRALYRGRQIHCQIVVNKVENDAVLSSALVDMYGKCDDVNNARSIVDTMIEPDEFSLSALITAFSKFGRFDEAKRLFDKTHNPGIVLWNSIIGGCASYGHFEQALVFFRRMMRKGVDPDSSTFASLLSACSCHGVLKNVIQIHAGILKYGFLDDIIVGSALVDSYSKVGCWDDAFAVFGELKVHDTVLLNSMINMNVRHGKITEARRLFDQIRDKSLISWNSMIVGYNQNGFADDALMLFAEMHSLGIAVDEVTLASVISASASLSLIGVGEQVFALTTMYGLESDQIIATSLVDLYCKCGYIAEGSRIFKAMIKFDEAPWNSMLMGYASNGMGDEVIRLFVAMRNTRVTPNVVTFIAILSACCHCGLVEEGLRWFDGMKNEYGINPFIEHYSCVVDLLVRAGRVEDAVRFIDAMPCSADASMWTSVLGGCKACGNKLLGDKAAKRLMELCPSHPGPYLQISSIHAVNGDWNGSQNVRSLIHERKMSKFPGFSWINR